MKKDIFLQEIIIVIIIYSLKEYQVKRAITFEIYAISKITAPNS